MLDNVRAVAFLFTSDRAKARAFYGDMLGLPLSEDDFALVARVGDAILRITTQEGFTGTGEPAFGFDVLDVSAAVAGLAAKGVAFERYDFLGDAQDASGVWTGPDGTKVAWFKDTDGNLLSFANHARS